MTFFRRNKAVITLLAVSFIGMFLSFSEYRQSIERIERENFKEEVRNHTRLRLESTKEYISEIACDLDKTSRAIAECDSIWDPKVADILDVANRMDYFMVTGVADTEGNGYDNLGREFQIFDKPYFQAALAGTVSFSEVSGSDKMPEKDLQIVASPMKDENGHVIGVTVGALDLEKLNSVIQQHTQTDGNLYIVDSDGNYISRFQPQGAAQSNNFWKDLSDVSSVNREISQIQEDFNNRKEGEFSFLDEGQYRYGYYMPIGTRNWQIVYTAQDITVEETLEDIFRADTRHTIVVGICYLLWCICIMLYFRKANQGIRRAHQEVSKNIEILHVALEHSNQHVFEYDTQTGYLRKKTDFPDSLFSEGTDRVTPEKCVEQNMIALHSADTFLQLFETIRTQEMAQADVQVNHGEKLAWSRISMYNVYENGEISVTVGFQEDITELKELERQAQLKLELQDALIAKALLYIKADIQTGELLEMSGEGGNLSYQEYLEQKLILQVVPESREYVSGVLSLDALRRKFRDGEDSMEVQFLLLTGKTKKWVSCMVYRHPLMPRKIALVITDIDKQKRKEIALQYQAERDGLTGLYNAVTTRRKIEEALACGIATGEKQLFILFDLDNYKLINDTFGHSCGDQVLVDVAQLLQKRFRISDIVGRIGGDEFVMLLRNISSYPYGESLVQELCGMIHRTYTHDGKTVELSASVGLTWAPVDGRTYQELYQKADVALYYVKNHSKNGYKRYEWQDASGEHIR